MRATDSPSPAFDPGPGYILSLGNEGIERIERDDEAGVFPDDTTARAHFLDQLERGDPYATSLTIRLLQPFGRASGSGQTLSQVLWSLILESEQLSASVPLLAAHRATLRSVAEQLELLEVVISVFSGLKHAPIDLDREGRF